MSGVLTDIKLKGSATHFTLDNNFNPTQIDFPGGGKRAMVNGGLKAPVQITSEATNNLQYERDLGFDDQGRISRHLRNPNQNGRWFVYDSLARLRTASNWNGPHMIKAGCPSKNYGMANDSLQVGGPSCTLAVDYGITSADTVLYDAVGNRTDKGGAYTAGNRLTNFNSCTYTSDNQNHVTARTCGAVITSFFWSIEDQLDSIHATGTPTGVKFLYDANGRVALKRVNGAVQSYFLWDGDNLLAELKPTADTLRAEYSYYGGLDSPHSLIVGGTRYYVRTDGLGNVLAITDTASAEKRSYTYDDWGHLTGGTDGLPFNNVDRARWKGALSMGPEAEVYFMRSRWYDPGTGRFLSEDPKGLGGGINPSVFAGNDPINHADPSGQYCIDWYDVWEHKTTFSDGTSVVTYEEVYTHTECTEAGPSELLRPPGGGPAAPRKAKFKGFGGAAPSEFAIAKACVAQQFGVSALAVRGVTASGLIPISKKALGFPQLPGSSAYVNPISAARFVFGDVHLPFGLSMAGTPSVFGAIGRLSPYILAALAINDVAEVASCISAADRSGGGRFSGGGAGVDF